MDPALTAAAIGVGGTVIVGVAGFWASVRNTNKTAALTLRAVELTEQGQVTDRYTKAIDQLGSGKLDVRIGGIYALERIARDSPRDHPTVMEVLAAFIRDHSREPWPPPAADQPGTDPPQRKTRADVQAAITVIGRRDDSQQAPFRINLAGVDLTRADLARLNLRRSVLTGADLAGAHLSHTNLSHTFLDHANLRSANLTSANIGGSSLADADLTGADLSGADIGDTMLTGANLTVTQLNGAMLKDANLTGANLALTQLTGAELTGANWPLVANVPEGWQRDTDSGRLKRANTDADGTATVRPPGMSGDSVSCVIRLARGWL